MPWNKIPLKIDSIKFFFDTKIFSFLKIENKKKPKVTNKNLKANKSSSNMNSDDFSMPDL